VIPATLPTRWCPTPLGLGKSFPPPPRWLWWAVTGVSRMLWPCPHRLRVPYATRVVGVCLGSPHSAWVAITKVFRLDTKRHVWTPLDTTPLLVSNTCWGFGCAPKTLQAHSLGHRDVGQPFHPPNHSCLGGWRGAHAWPPLSCVPCASPPKVPPPDPDRGAHVSHTIGKPFRNATRRCKVTMVWVRWPGMTCPPPQIVSSGG